MNRPPSRAPEPRDWWLLALCCIATASVITLGVALYLAWPLL